VHNLNRLFSDKMKRNVLVPGWITMFGIVALSAPPVGVAASVTLFLIGVVAPALWTVRGPGVSAS
jgi:hypothetical protein